MHRAIGLYCCVFLALVVMNTARAEDPPQFILEWGSEGSDPGQFVNPWGVAVDQDGHVYVADAGNDRIQKFTNGGVFLLEWGVTGTGDGEFMSPIDVSVDSDGDLWVMDSYLYGDRLQKFDTSGNFLMSVNVDGDRSAGIGAGAFVFHVGYPGYQVVGHALNGAPDLTWETSNSIGTDVAVNEDGNVFVAEWYYSWFSWRTWISVFTSDGTLISVRETSDISSCFSRLALNTGNDIIATAAENKVVILDSSGLLLTEWGEEGSGESQFLGPTGVAIDQTGNIFVADNENHRIQKFGHVGPAIECIGFESPMDRGPVTPSPKRVLPFKAQLVDAAGIPITDMDIVSPPRIEIVVDSGVLGNPEPPQEELPIGAATEGNEFEFNPATGLWVYHLRSSDFSATGTYTVTMETGDTGEYSIDPTCVAEFVIE